jgi:hypothetical protein
LHDEECCRIEERRRLDDEHHREALRNSKRFARERETEREVWRKGSARRKNPPVLVTGERTDRRRNQIRLLLQRIRLDPWRRIYR